MKERVLLSNFFQGQARRSIKKEVGADYNQKNKRKQRLDWFELHFLSSSLHLSQNYDLTSFYYCKLISGLSTMLIRYL